MHQEEADTVWQGCHENYASCTQHIGACGAGGIVGLKSSLHFVHQEAFVTLHECYLSPAK